MTNQVYYSETFTKHLEKSDIISSFELPIINKLIDYCSPSDLFVVSTWCEVDDNIKSLVSKKPKRAIVYSGMDWHDDSVRKPFHDFLNYNIEEVVNIGNCHGNEYFSFWLFFIEKVFDTYTEEQLTPVSLEYLYMCLNRKRHDHRIELVKKLKETNLLEKGLVSLGGDQSLNIPPLVLPIDITSAQGDFADASSTLGITNDINSLGNLNNWNSALINVVTETTHHSDTFISEKTWKPIIGLRPFMILGDLKVYSYLKEYGIDTFDDVFGTGYLENDYMKRIEWIVETLESFKNADLSRLYSLLLPRLLKNKKRMSEIFKLNENRFNNVLDTLNKS